METLRKEDGYSLLEVLVAITIFAVGLLAVASMQASAIRINSTAGELTNLSAWGMDKIEELSVLPYADPMLDPAGNPHEEVSEDYTVSWTVINNHPVINTKRITVTITGRNKKATFSVLKPNL